MTKLLLIFLSFLCCTHALCAQSLAPISGFARNFVDGKPIANAKITLLETKQQLTTDTQGRFGPFLYPVNQAVTLEFKKWGYKTTQSVTVINPPQGLMTANNNITFQVPSSITFFFFKLIIGAHLDAKYCHVATTITAPNKTLDDPIQGEAHAKIVSNPVIKEKPFYFDLFERGPWKTKTNPFTRNLMMTSPDGGVAFFNVPVSDKPYTITAEKKGKQFTRAQFICRQDAFINISPPHGPMLIE